jgi:O-antigen/teichoic acid export membrane protein
VFSEELRRLGRRAIIVNLGWIVEALAGFLFVGYVTRVIAPSQYAVLVFAGSIAGLMMLLELGTTGFLVPSFVRESVNRSAAGVATLFRTSLASLTVTGAIVLLLSAAVALIAPAVTRSSAFGAPQARAVIMIFGLTATITLPSRAYELLFEAHARYGTLAFVRATSATLRLVASMAVVAAGYGIVGVAVVTVVLAAFRFIAFAAASRVAFPEVRAFGPRDWSMLRRVARNAGWAAVDNIGRQVAMLSDAALLALVAPVQAVALYGVGSRVPLLAWSAVGRALGVSMQAASEHDAMGDDDGVREVFRSTALLATTVVWPLLIVMIVFAEPFLRVWVGDTYLGAASTMRWLLVAGIAFALHAAAHVILFARGRVDVIAKITVAEGIANVTLSLILGYRYGASGPAMATALTVTVATIGFFIPAACRSIELSPVRVARELAAQAALPVAVVAFGAVALRALLPHDRPLLQCVAAGILALVLVVRVPLLILHRGRGIGPTRPVANAG